MSLNLVDSEQACDLSACRSALLLGVFTPENRIRNLLNVAQAALQCDVAMLHFQEEPYLWWSKSQSSSFKAIPRDLELETRFNFDCVGVIDKSNMHYQDFSEDLQAMGFQHHQFIAFNFDLAPMSTKGQLILFDANPQLIAKTESIQLMQNLIESLVCDMEQRADYEQLKELYEQQCALNKSKTKFFQIIAHDLRAPFQGLLGFSELLLQERQQMDDAGIQNITEYLYGTAKSTFNLLENLLNWAVAEGGRMEFHPVHFHLKQVSNIVIGVLNTVALKKNITLEDHIEEELMIYADINMVTSVIQNLVSNALKFTQIDGKGSVIISAKLVQHHVEICVTDSGVGMNEAQIIKIFQPHTKVSLKGTSGEKGVGLGLLLCKRFIDINHGKLTISSKPGQGTTVRVSLPRSEATQA